MPTRWAVDGLDAVTWRGLGLEAAWLPIVVIARLRSRVRGRRRVAVPAGMRSSPTRRDGAAYRSHRSKPRIIGRPFAPTGVGRRVGPSTDGRHRRAARTTHPDVPSDCSSTPKPLPIAVAGPAARTASRSAPDAVRAVVRATRRRRGRPRGLPRRPRREARDQLAEILLRRAGLGAVHGDLPARRVLPDAHRGRDLRARPRSRSPRRCRAARSGSTSAAATA